MLPVDKFLDIAIKELGYLEKASNEELDDKVANAGSKNYTKYARDLDALGFYNGKKQGFYWCCVFVDWCMYAAFGLKTTLKISYQQMGGLGAGVKYKAQYYKNKGKFFTSNPQPGDLIFFGSGTTWQHVGIVEKIENSYVHTIEGNTTSTYGVVPNGGGVHRKKYNIDYYKILGYGRPDWSSVPEEEKEMTEQDVIRLIQEEEEKKYYKTLDDVPSSYKPSIEALMEAGVITGYDGGKDGLIATIGDNTILVDETFCRIFTILSRPGALEVLKKLAKN